jgi:hypothetical protein
MPKLPNDEEREQYNEDVDAIWWPVLKIIQASHLNCLDPDISVKHKFDGILKRERKGIQSYSSLSLFKDDLECLLRDLYGNITSEALDAVLSAVFSVVRGYTKYLRKDLWKEHDDAVEFDYILGIGCPDGYGISSSDWRRGMIAKSHLFSRVCEVQANPSAFSEYTVRFADRFSQDWDCSPETALEARSPMPSVVGDGEMPF